MRVAVIGAGPSGLVTLKYLKTAHEFFPGMEPIEAMLFEAESSIGGTYKYRSYEDAEVGLRDPLTITLFKCSRIENPDKAKHNVAGVFQTADHLLRLSLYSKFSRLPLHGTILHIPRRLREVLRSQAQHPPQCSC